MTFTRIFTSTVEGRDSHFEIYIVEIEENEEQIERLIDIIRRSNAFIEIQENIPRDAAYYLKKYHIEYGADSDIVYLFDGKINVPPYDGEYEKGESWFEKYLDDNKYPDFSKLERKMIKRAKA